MTEHATRSNILGELRAEKDKQMLDRAFYASHDYRTLHESSDRNLVVGRRGTGKSALVYKLVEDWGKLDRTRVIALSPEEDQIASLRTTFELFGSEFSRIRAAGKMAWRYALVMECLESLRFYKEHKVEENLLLKIHIQRWRRSFGGVSAKLREVLREVVDKASPPEDRLADLARNLQINQLTAAVSEAMSSVNRKAILLIDKLDEGYEPNPTGVAVVDGFVQAAIDFSTFVPTAKAYVFLRDNIYRAVAHLDPDYSRNIEGHVLRLHWDEYQLFNLVCNRLRAAFALNLEDNRKLWNRCTSKSLQGQEGFKKCLQLTLYRPRDIISLLNNAYLSARNHDRKEIIEDDIESTAKVISETRLQDLLKEYEKILPGLTELTSAFRNTSPEMDLDTCRHRLQPALDTESASANAQQTFRLLENADTAIRALYGVGFIGLMDKSTKSFTFCHDGKSPDRTLASNDRILVHPCYWMALNLDRNVLNPEEAQEIFDEYDIEVSSETPQLRNAAIGRIMTDLSQIPEGSDGAGAFEEWTLKTLRTIFARGLTNFGLHPNGASVQRRDVVASNPGESTIWRRILDDYGSRQVIFEVKNYKELGQEEFRQLSTYLTGPYGRLAFIVTRDDEFNPRKGRELDWIREIYMTQNSKLVIKLTGKYLSNLLSKLRSIQKHNQAEQSLGTLLDTYERNYLSLPSTRTKKKK